MTTNVIVGKFRKPEPQSNLNGQLGLTVKDIAESLGIEAGNVRQKLGSRGMVDRLKSLKFNIITVANFNSNGVEYVDYVLDVNAAKFFVAKYENAQGDAYLKYLVEVESDAVQEGLTNHIDPTNLSDYLNNPRKLSQMFAIMADTLDAEKAKTAEAIRTKAQISDKKTATAMATASAATRKLKLIEEQVGIADNFKTATGWIREFPKLKSLGSEVKIGQLLTKYCKSNDLEISTTPHEKWGKVNIYPRKAAESLLKV